MNEFLGPQQFSAFAIQSIGSALTSTGSFPMAQICASSISNTCSPLKTCCLGNFVMNQELKSERKERFLLNRMKRTRNRRALSPLRLSPSQRPNA